MKVKLSKLADAITTVRTKVFGYGKANADAVAEIVLEEASLEEGGSLVSVLRIKVETTGSDGTKQTRTLEIFDDSEGHDPILTDTFVTTLKPKE